MTNKSQTTAQIAVGTPDGKGWRGWVVGGVLIVTALLYGRTGGYGFINFDDSSYVYENTHTRSGLTPENMLWALTTGTFSNWHPLTWMSYMLDVDWFGMRPGPMHLVNVGFHLANTLLLFLLIRRLLNRFWPAVWVAAMFGWHPLHVESVAWIAERKDVLSTFFFFSCLVGYCAYTHRPRWGMYLLVLTLLILGLMAKPMLVTVPFLMLLLDAWPLKRFAKQQQSQMPLSAFRTPYSVLIEKVPMIVIVLASCVVTYVAQAKGRSVGTLPLVDRLMNSMIAYGVYLRQIFIPRHLAIFYPLPESRPTMAMLVSLAGFMLISSLVVHFRQSIPGLLIGWLWYLGTLVPVIGLVQVGSQSHADRYTYVPAVGIFIAVASVGSFILERYSRARVALCVCAAISATVMLPLTWRQVGYWQNSGTVMGHAAEVVPRNYLAYSSLGEYYESIGQSAAAAEQYQKALAIRPNDAVALNNLAVQALVSGDVPLAIARYRAAISADPDYLPAYNNYGNLLMKQGRGDEAINVYRNAIKRDPTFRQAYHNLALALASRGQLDPAIALWRQSIDLDPNYADALAGLGQALMMKGQTREGIASMQSALRLDENRVDLLTTLAWILATHSNLVYQNGPEALRLANRAVELSHGAEPLALDAQAAALARVGNFPAAATAAEKAAKLADEQRNTKLADAIAKRLAGYRASVPYTASR